MPKGPGNGPRETLPARSEIVGNTIRVERSTMFIGFAGDSFNCDRVTNDIVTLLQVLASRDVLEMGEITSTTPSL
jgi:hypothetical protein